jgi:hypothetical protein
MLHMKHRTRIYYTETDKALMWERWRRGESLQAIAQLFDRNHSAIGGILARIRDRQKNPLYFGPKAPAGLESNWIPTMGKMPYVWLRLYGPEDAFWNKLFKMPDVELVN